MLGTPRALFESTGSKRQYRDRTVVPAVLGGRNLLFSEAAQAVYELDDFSAFVWHSMNYGLSPELIAGEIIDAGGDPEKAHAAVAAAVLALEAIETSDLKAPPPSPSVPIERLTRITFALAGIAVQLSISKALVPDLDAAFGHLKSDQPQSHVQLSAYLTGDAVQIHVAGRRASSCGRSEFVPLVKALLIESVLQNGSQVVALHAAALVHDGIALLLLGSPGAGKTTLATALVRRGFTIASDDVVLLDEAGLITGLPLPFTIKEGAWSLLSEDWPGLKSQAAHHRPDGIKVRYLQDAHFVDQHPRPIRFVIQLDRQAGGPATLQSIAPISALKALVAEGDARDERLSETGFRSLVSALRGTRCFRLTYSDLSEAAEIVNSIYS